MLRPGPLACALLLAASIVSGQAAVGGEPARVYTNADLERLPPLPASAQSSAADDLGWEFVIDFLAEQHARIDAQRAYELDRTLVEETARRSREASRPRYGLPLGYLPWSCYPGGACAPRRPSPSPEQPGHGPRAWVVPLHARRPLAPGPARPTR